MHIASYVDDGQPSIGAALNRAAKLLRRLADKRLARFGVTSGYLPVITALAAREGQTQKSLTRRAGIEQPTMAATLVRMERDGLVERRVDAEGGRSPKFYFTDAARSLLPSLRAAIDGYSAEIVDELSRAENDALRLILNKMTGRLETLLDSETA